MPLPGGDVRLRLTCLLRQAGTLARPCGWPALLFWLGFVLTVAGVVANRMWSKVPWSETALLASLVAGASLVGLLARRPLRVSMPTAVAVVWCVALVYFVGLAPFGAVLLLALASLGVGSIIIPVDCPARAALSVMAGFAVIGATIGWLLPFPVHTRVVYVVALLAAIALRGRAILGILHSIPQGWRRAVGEAPAAMWLAITATGVATTAAWLPTIDYDDLAYHLALPSQLIQLGYYRMDAASNLWAVNAWAADVLQAAAWMLAGHESRGAMDALWLLIALVLMWRLGEALGLSTRRRCIAVALYACLPLTVATLTGMQTEGPTAAVAVGIALLIQTSPGPDRRQLHVLGLLFGLLLALKVSNLTIAGPLGLWLLWRWRMRLPWRWLPTAALLFVVVAGSSYVYGWILTGNPVLPLFNTVFRSPYTAISHSAFTVAGELQNPHPRWVSTIDLGIIWNMVFHTSRYALASDGAAGFFLVGLAGSFLVAVYDKRARPLALTALLAFFLPLTQALYLRYAQQALILMIPAMLCGVPAESAPRSARARWLMAALAALVAGNLVFVPTAEWQLRNGALAQLLGASRRDFMTNYAPIDRMVDVVNQRYGASARVLIASGNVPFSFGDVPFAALFGGRAFVVNWYDQELFTRAVRADKDATGAAWTALLGATGANLLVVQTGHVSHGLQAALAASHGTLVLAGGGLQLWRLHGSPIAGKPLPGNAGTVNVGFAIHGEATRRAVLARGRLLLRCTPEAGPISVGWTLAQQHAGAWSYSNWVDCLADGTAHAILDVSAPAGMTALTASARLVTPNGTTPTLVSATLDVRPDLGFERDLARRMRWRIRSAMADWIDPWGMSGGTGGAVQLPSPAGSVDVKLHAADMSSRGGWVRAVLALACRPAPAPIVVGWKAIENGHEPKSNYAWATCGSGHHAESRFMLHTATGLASLTATAVPPKGDHDGLRLAEAQIEFVPTGGLSGLLNRVRMRLAVWLRPTATIARFDP